MNWYKKAQTAWADLWLKGIQDRTRKLSNIKVLDNGGSTLDRYAIVIDSDLYSMSVHPKSPTGINQFLGKLLPGDLEKISEHIKEIPFNSLSEEVKQAIMERL